jgi:hypothetical protein
MVEKAPVRPLKAPTCKTFGLGLALLTDWAEAGALGANMTEATPAAAKIRQHANEFFADLTIVIYCPL